MSFAVALLKKILAVLYAPFRGKGPADLSDCHVTGMRRGKEITKLLPHTPIEKSPDSPKEESSVKKTKKAGA